MTTYETITNKIIEQLEKGTVPWKQPWKTGLPKNMVSNKDYHGMNSMLLNMAGFSSNCWLTFKQCNDLEGSVKSGEKGWPIIYWNFKEVEKENSKGELVTDTFAYLKHYTVFNVTQCNGISVPKIEKKQFDSIEKCEEIVTAYKNKPEIKEGEARAYYTPKEDTISMPLRSIFNSLEEYYSTLFHELTHSTGHEKRLNRRASTEAIHFGDSLYSKEELVAEIGSSFLCAVAGISNSVIDNQSSYIGGWLKKLRGDSKLVITASAQAQKASDYILNKI